MAAQYELLSQLLKSGGRLDMGQELFYKFYQAFVLKDRWLQYIGGVGATRCWGSLTPCARCTPP